MIPAHSSLKSLQNPYVANCTKAGDDVIFYPSFDFFHLMIMVSCYYKITIKDCSRVCGQPTKQLFKTKGIKSTKPKHSINSLTWL